MFLVPVAHGLFIRRIEILGQDDISVLPDRHQPRFCTDGTNVRMANLFAPIDVILQIQIVAEVHFRSCRLKNHAFLPPVRLWKFNFAIQPAGTEEGWIEGVGAVGGHDDFDVGRLVETVHLVQQFEQNALNFPVCPGLCVVPFGRNGIDFVDEHYTG